MEKSTEQPRKVRDSERTPRILFLRRALVNSGSKRTEHVTSGMRGSSLRLRAWCGIARNQTHRPLHHLQPHFLKVRTFPRGWNVAEAIIKHPTLAVTPDPDDGEISVRALHAFAGEIEFVGVEGEQYAHILPGEILNLINFVEERERHRKIVHSRER